MKNSMHLDSGKHPFQGNGKTPKPKMARMVGLSANAAMKKKRPMQGPGTA